MAKQKYYVVWRGREIGIFTDWASCKKQVYGFTGARYKSFATRAEAQAAFSGGKPTATAAATAPGATTSNAKISAKPTVKSSQQQTVKTHTATEIAALDYATKIFTDGGCEPNPGEAGSGVAIYREGTISELWYGLYNAQGTNNTAELNALFQALIMATEELEKERSTAIFCDSKYAIQCVTQWAINWQKRGWKKAGGEIKNLQLIQEMFALHQTIKERVPVLHVNGHVGVEGNELADRMSIKAISERTVGFDRFTGQIDVNQLLALRAG